MPPTGGGDEEAFDGFYGGKVSFGVPMGIPSLICLLHLVNKALVVWYARINAIPHAAHFTFSLAAFAPGPYEITPPLTVGDAVSPQVRGSQDRGPAHTCAG